GGESPGQRRHVEPGPLGPGGARAARCGAAAEARSATGRALAKAAGDCGATAQASVALPAGARREMQSARDEADGPPPPQSRHSFRPALTGRAAKASLATPTVLRPSCARLAPDRPALASG